MATNPSAPSLSIDLFSDAVRVDPRTVYRQIRDAGPVCELPRHGALALGRHADCRAILSNWRDFSSASGVTLNQTTNRILAGTALASDPPEHTRIRGIITRPFSPRRLADLKGRLAELTVSQVRQLIGAGPFEAVTQLASLLPLTVISEMVGLPEEGRESMLDWAAAAFNGVAPEGNATSDAALSVLGGMVGYITDPALPKRLRPGSWAAALWDCVDSGEMTAHEFGSIIQAYVTPSLDTTINGTASMLWLLASHPDQWALLKQQPTLVSRCVNEALRLESPVNSFSRVAQRDVDVGGTVIARGSRVMALFGSANRDERRYEHPDRFMIERDSSDHLAFGHGVHRCAGGNLAVLEITAILEALVQNVNRIELVSARRSPSLGLRGFSSLELTLD